MSFQIIRDDITRVSADAIVNTANPQPAVGGGTDTAVYEAAGREELEKARAAIGVIAEGDAAVTPAFHLHAKIIIHAVSPVWIDGQHREIELLQSCYRRSLELAEQYECSSIAFPLMAAGSNGFPKDRALQTALHEIQRYLLNHEMDITLVVFDKSVYQLSGNVFTDVKSYIEDHEVDSLQDFEYAAPSYARHKRIGRENSFFGLAAGYLRPAEAPFEEAAIRLPKTEDTFQKKLFEWIDASGETDPEIYKRAGLDRKLFAKIRRDENYKPSRKTAAALALALHLSLKDAEDLLSRAGYALSQSTQSDLILRYCFEHQVYNLVDVNSILFQFDQEML